MFKLNFIVNVLKGANTFTVKYNRNRIDKKIYYICQQVETIYIHLNTTNTIKGRKAS